MTTGKDESSSSLMKMVEVIISPQDARELVAQYESRAWNSDPSATPHELGARIPELRGCRRLDNTNWAQ
ncbi:hypothetical protein HA62_12060 [Pseudomonas putida]|nr:hypothetical protein HA62_12060 [Pseudomonas putida]